MRSLPLTGCRGDAPWSLPLHLEAHAATVATLDVAEGEVVAVVVDQRVRAVLLPERHVLHVLGEGEERGDLLDREIAARAGLTEQHFRPLLGRLRHLPATAMLIRLDTGPLPSMRWSASYRGYCRAHVASPARFYASFLRNTEELDGERFTHVAEALVSEIVAGETPPEDPEVEKLERRWGRRAARGLREVGLELEDFEVVDRERQTPPVARESTPAPPPLASEPR